MFHIFFFSCSYRWKKCINTHTRTNIFASHISIHQNIYWHEQAYNRFWEISSLSWALFTEASDKVFREGTLLQNAMHACSIHRLCKTSSLSFRTATLKSLQAYLHKSFKTNHSKACILNNVLAQSFHSFKNVNCKFRINVLAQFFHKCFTREERKRKFRINVHAEIFHSKRGNTSSG